MVSTCKKIFVGSEQAERHCGRAVTFKWKGGHTKKKMPMKMACQCTLGGFFRELVNLETFQHFCKVCFPAQIGVNWKGIKDRGK